MGAGEALARSEALSPTGGGRSVDSWGLWLFILTEAALFAFLIASYFYVRNAAPSWPIGDIRPPELRLATINTGILLLSSVPMHWALTSIRKGEEGRMKVGLLLGMALGVLFLALQLLEYHHKEFTPATNAYGSLFFTITGFHGSHVLMGLVFNLFVQARAAGGRYDAENHVGVENAVTYWHFVDVVWIFVFASLYLSEHFLVV